MFSKQERQLVMEKSELILERTIKQTAPEYYRALSNVLYDYIAATSPEEVEISV